MKKCKTWLNTFSYLVTYLFQCNTDITSLRSGMAIKGVLLYVSNYVTKLPLKTHVIFDTVCSVFEKNSEMVGGSDTRKEKAHKLMMKIVNSLSTKMEMGSPMISMYLLGNPDHYKSHKFPMFYWQSFVQECRKPWVCTDPAQDSGVTSKVGEEGEMPNKVAIIKHNGWVIGLSPVLDYVFRPEEISHMSLHKWVSRCERKKKPTGKTQSKTHVTTTSESGDKMDSDSNSQESQPTKHSLLSFQEVHPLADSHGTQCHPPSKAHVPNFVGATLPRFNQGDHEYYCCTMLTLFKPWRFGLDLKNREESWDDAFSATSFFPRQLKIMKNMNIWYEYLDARDDFHAQMKKGTTQIPNMGGLKDWFFVNPDDMMIEESVGRPNKPLTIDEDTISAAIGRWERARCGLMNNTRRILSSMGWSETWPSSLSKDIGLHLSPLFPTMTQAPTAWKAAIAAKWAEVLENWCRYLPPHSQSGIKPSNFVPEEVRVVQKSYLSNTFTSKEWQKAIDDISERFHLNKNKTVLSRLLQITLLAQIQQLMMYVGGMASTGKSQVLKALLEFFSVKKESHCLIIVAPTGTAVALLGGLTYHSAFGINTDGLQTSNIQLSQVESRLEGVEYVFLDEVSMLICIRSVNG